MVVAPTFKTVHCPKCKASKTISYLYYQKTKCKKCDVEMKESIWARLIVY